MVGALSSQCLPVRKLPATFNKQGGNARNAILLSFSSIKRVFINSFMQVYIENLTDTVVGSGDMVLNQTWPCSHGLAVNYLNN